METLNNEQREKLAQINENEARQSEKNLQKIQSVIISLSMIERQTSETLGDLYEEGDRRSEACDEALTKIDEALKALQDLRGYEVDTIKQCTGQEEVFVKMAGVIYVSK